MIPETKLEALIARHAAVERELSGQTDRESYVRLSREFAELNPLVEAIKRYRAVAEEINGLESLIAEHGYSTESVKRSPSAPPCVAA